MASIRQRGGKWQARVIRTGFPAVVKTFDTHGDAQRWARSIERGIHIAVDHGRPVEEEGMGLPNFVAVTSLA